MGHGESRWQADTSRSFSRGRGRQQGAPRQVEVLQIDEGLKADDLADVVVGQVQSPAHTNTHTQRYTETHRDIHLQKGCGGGSPRSDGAVGTRHTPWEGTHARTHARTSRLREGGGTLGGLEGRGSGCGGSYCPAAPAPLTGRSGRVGTTQGGGWRGGVC